MPKKGKRGKAKGKEVVPGISGKPAAEAPRGIPEVPGIQAGSTSVTPAVEQESTGPSPSVEESSRHMVPVYPSTSTVSAEEALARMSIEMKYESSTAGWPFAKRPGFGTLGNRIQLITNCFKIDIPSGYIYHYDVDTYIKPNKPVSGAGEKKKFRCLNTRENREVLERAVKNAQTNAKNLLHGVLPAYDGRKNLYTRKRLKLNAGETKEIPVDFQSKQYVIEIKPVSKKDQDAPSISLEPLHQLFEGRARSFTEEMRMAVMALETILRHGPALKYVPLYRSFYYRPRQEELEPLGPGREIWLGYYQSLQISQWKPMITIDTSATAFYESCPVVNRVMSILYPRVPEEHIDGELHRIRGLTGGQIQALLREMKNLLVEVVHLEYPRKYRIHDITSTSARDTYFDEEVEGKKVKRSVAEYFGKKYPRHKLKYPNLPCIVGSVEKKTFVPFEVCKIASGQAYNKELSEDERTKMIKQTCFVPNVKFKKIKDRLEITKRDLERSVFGSQSFALEFGICINTSFTQLEGRVLGPPHLAYNLKQPILPVDGEWNMNDKHFFKCCEPVNRWILINFANLSDGQTRDFAERLINDGALVGIEFARPIASISGRRDPPALCIQKEMQQHRGLQLAIIILPPKKQNKTIYREIKISCETKFGLMTQCIAEKNARECKKSVLCNLFQKINAKLGGQNNSLAPLSKPQVFKKPVIIIGADCTHPSPGDTVELSVAAVVGSLDSAPSKYKTSLRIQVPEETKEMEKKAKEIILELKDMVKEVLLAFRQHTRNQKPEKIIFYRDGVSEGEFRQVLQKEVGQIRKACDELDSEYKPGITFIVVGKRHHTRFMPENRGDSRGGKGNVPPGTTVDTVVTHPLYSDYFMCSHLGIQGTSRPAHYTVLWDDNDLKADELQQLTYYMCYTYTRCTRSISIPCPVMYAHLAAYRAKQYLVHWRERQGGRTEYRTSADELREMNEAIRVHRDIENRMYFT